MKKKLFFLLVVAAMSVATLTGCGSNNKENLTTETQKENEITEEDKGAVEDNSDTKDNSSADVDVSDSETAEKSGDDNDKETDNSKLLVAYFSRADENYNVGYVEKGNTAILAEMVAEITGGDLFEIKPVKAYPADYDECTDVAKKEQSDNARPELASTVDNMEQYSVCILCYPIWWGDLPMPVYSFLDGYDWNGKTIITLNTHEGSGKAGTPDKISSYLSGATVVDGLAMEGQTAQNSQDEARKQVEDWLEELGYKNN